MLEISIRPVSVHLAFLDPDLLVVFFFDEPDFLADLLAFWGVAWADPPWAAAPALEAEPLDLFVDLFPFDWVLFLAIFLDPPAFLCLLAPPAFLETFPLATINIR